MSALDFTARALALRAAGEVSLLVEELTGTMLRRGASQADVEAMIAAMSASRTGPLVGTNYLSECELGYRIEPGYYAEVGALSKSSGKAGLIAPSLGSVVIKIPDNAYFLEHAGQSVGVHFENIVFLGGRGAYRSTHSGSNVQGNHTFRNCYFIDYTECAIQNSAIDHPYLKLYDCVFKGKAGVNTIGVAWGGLLDGLRIEGCEFQRNAIDLKLGGGVGSISGSFAVRDSSFLSFGGTAKQADVWIVPPHLNGGTGINSGYTGLFQHNKFGNENQTSGSARVLIAAESLADVAAGKARGAIFPELTWNPSSGGYTDIVTGLIFDANRWSAIAGSNAPVIRSYLSDVRALTFTEFNQFDGAAYNCLCEFMGARTFTYVNLNWNVAINPVGHGGIKTFPFVHGVVGRFNAGAWVEMPVGQIQDPAGLAGTIEGVVPCAPVQFDHGYAVWKDARPLGAWASFGIASVTGFADGYGAATGQEIAFAGVTTASMRYSSLPASSTSRRAWVTLLGLEKPAALAAEKVRVLVYRHDGRTIDQRDIPLPPNGSPRSICYPVDSPDDGAATYRVALCLPAGGYAAGTRTTVRFQGAYLNFGQRPAPFGHVRVAGSMAWDGPHIVTDTNVHIWRTSNGLLRTKASAPASENEGTVLGATPYRGCLARLSASVSNVDYTAGVAIPWDGADVYDTDGIHDPASNNTRLTVPAGASKVRVKASARIDGSASGKWLTLAVHKNGSASYIGAGFQSAEISATVLSYLEAETAVIPVSPGDYFEAVVASEIGTSITVDAASSGFAMEIIE